MDDILTAEQAIESAKGLTFETVWAALMEDRKRMRESDERMREQIRESNKRTDKIIADLSKNIGGLGNSLGRFTEAMFQTELWKKFNELGYEFSTQSIHKKFILNKQVIAEADFFLENGEIVMPVEVKTELTEENVNEHIERIEKIRRYLDERNDSRKLVGAVAGAVVTESVLNYAHKKGFYVIVQSGDAVTVSLTPKGFEARKW